MLRLPLPSLLWAVSGGLLFNLSLVFLVCSLECLPLLFAIRDVFSERGTRGLFLGRLEALRIAWRALVTELGDTLIMLQR